MDDSYQYLTEVEVSQMTRMAVQTLRNDRFNGRWIPYSKIGRSVRYSHHDVVVYMESRISTTSGRTGHMGHILKS